MAKKIAYKRKVINDVKDYLRIDDFYSKLRERDDYLGNSLDDMFHYYSVVEEQNEKCRELAEAALEKIDCNKYK